jgi:DNA-binding NtrC family response regulator
VEDPDGEAAPERPPGSRGSREIALALVVDDDPDFRASVCALVAREGFAPREAGSLEEARAAIAEAQPDLVLVDLQLPDGLGAALLEESDLASDTEFVVVTGNASVESAVDAMRRGALDYLTKPFDHTRLASVLANVARTRSLKQRLQALRGELRELGRFGRLVGRSKPMQEDYNLISRVAPTSATVLVTGESGTGKELVAETIHALSRRSERPLFAVNCGAVSPNLIESELFGHEKGSFTGADRQRLGYFERAAGGTIFLDEITEMPAELQVKLLRVLEAARFLRVGGNESSEADVRISAASNRDPPEAVSRGVLREDLYYRLNVVPVALPPLRARGEDHELLAQHFLDELNRCEEHHKRWSAKALEEIRSRGWPGNVRELRNAVQRAFILADREIGPEAIQAINLLRDDVASGSGDTLEIPVASEIAAVEKRLILATLDHFRGDKKQSAQALGISLKTLYNRLKVYRAEAKIGPE